jgi:hypothetical protein
MDDIPHGTIGAGMAGGSASRREFLGGAATFPGSSGATSPGSPSLFLLWFSDCASPSINWRRVDGEAQLACS